MAQKSAEELQPDYYKQFRCLADRCPDTCCEGWRVGIDRHTYGKYQASSDPVLAPAFARFVHINEARTSDDQYAVFTTSGGRCAFLSEGLCSIQSRLGESELGAACAAFPRVTNLVGGVFERSLDLACPEAARLALADPAPLRFTGAAEYRPSPHVAAAAPGRIALGGFTTIQAAEIRAFVLALLKRRQFTLSERLGQVGILCERLGDLAARGDCHRSSLLLHSLQAEIDGGLPCAGLRAGRAAQGAQLSLIFELVVERVQSDFTPARFLKLYEEEFLSGIGWKPEAAFDRLAENYAQAYHRHYMPFMSRHEHLLENYLVNNAFKTLFPFGQESVVAALELEPARVIPAQGSLFCTYFVLSKAMLIGVAGHRQSALDLGTAIGVVQLCSKTFEHSFVYARKILEILKARKLTNAAALRVLLEN